MPRSSRVLAPLVLALLALPPVMADEPGTAAASSACLVPVAHVEDVGPACPRADGLLEVFDASLRSLGTIHGSDPVPAGPEPDVAASGTSPACVDGATGTYYVQVIYARATNDADAYAAQLSTIRWMVGAANQLVDQAGLATGSPASLKVKCVAGVVEVKNEVLPTAAASATFSTIVSDLRAKGYADPKVKYWVFYDDTSACSCAGQGHVYGDSSPGVTNANNGNAQSTFAIDYGYNSTRTWLHELGHNLGAVQNDAPRTTGAYHCTDGRDTMCYNDGGPNGASYTTSTCAVEVFDCNKDTYFHTNPPPGSYLATRWNLGSAVNRYIQLGVPTLESLLCTANVPLGNATTCTFRAADDGTGVRYTLDWGDGTTTQIPAAPAFVAPATDQTATRTYATAGNRTITASVIDNDGRAGNALVSGITVRLDAPVLAPVACPASVERGATATCTVRAQDNSSGVRYTIQWGDETSVTLPASGFALPSIPQNASHAYAAAGAKTIVVDVVDSAGVAGAPRSATVAVFADPPVIQAFSCASPVELGRATNCTMMARDNSSGLRYTVDWGDETTTVVPGAGAFVAPNGTQAASRTYAANGTHAATLGVVDVYGSSAVPRVSNVTVLWDLTPPSLALSEPRSGYAYAGCGTVQTLVFATLDPVWLGEGCVRALVADARSGVASVDVLIDGVLLASDTSAPFDLSFPVDRTRLDALVTVRATDAAGNAATTLVRVDMISG